MGSYDEQDLKRIIKRAAELQKRSGGPDSLSRPHTELSLDEIQDIAREMGVSPDFVREAALEYEGIPVEEPLALDTGDKYRKEMISFVKGELDQKTWAEMRSIIEYHFDAPGKVIRRPKGIKWKAQPKGISKWLATRKSPEVEVKSSGGQTSIRIRKSLKTYQKLTWPAWFFVGVAFMVFSIMLTEGPGGDDVIGIMMGIAASLGAAQLFRKWAQRKVRKAGEELREAMEQLQTIVARRFRAGSPSREQGRRPATELPDQAEGTHDIESGTEDSSAGRSPEEEPRGGDSRLQNVLRETPKDEEEEDAGSGSGSVKSGKEKSRS
ncbi:MAG: hypothetical protein U5K31_07460 [Balneolaceae bacterium]|nr:hypothetical protein [Balneolaceae bacterium]